MAAWFTQPRFDLGGASTQDIITRVRDLAMEVGPAWPDADPDQSLRSHAIEGARFALNDFLADPAAVVVLRGADLDPAILRSSFEAGRFDVLCIDLDHVITVGLTADFPEGEMLVRETISAYADGLADLDREFPRIPPEGADRGCLVHAKPL